MMSVTPEELCRLMAYSRSFSIQHFEGDHTAGTGISKDIQRPDLALAIIRQKMLLWCTMGSDHTELPNK